MKQLSECRQEIDAIDKELLRLFHRRMEVVYDVAAYKAEHNLPVRDKAREAAILEKTNKRAGQKEEQNSAQQQDTPKKQNGTERYDADFHKTLIELSCAYQEQLLASWNPESETAPANTLTINCSNGTYDIVVENGALDQLNSLLSTTLRADSRILIVTDDGVPRSYLNRVLAQFPTAITHTVPQGEQSKSFEHFEAILSTLLTNRFTRNDCIVALGGGVVGDLSGFCAACYMRGIAFYNIPTTLLSQIDSSIGGKTAIDFNGTKNTVGAFWQPKKVVIDPEVLQTLDPRQLRAGLAEMIKMAATGDASLFESLESLAAELNTKAAGAELYSFLSESLPALIVRTLRIKQRVVDEDPLEQGLRKVLNFGHTIGHAIESHAKGELLHGECVALGMLPLTEKPAHGRLEALLSTFGLPTQASFCSADLEHYLHHDKKMQSNGVKVVTVERIGSFSFQTMSVKELCQHYDDCFA